jgi:hypothetical protein
LEFYAHSSERRPPPHWHPLATHLQAVSELAAQFCAAFDSAGWGRLAGLWHDLGKYRAEFQRRLTGDQSGCITDQCGLSEGQRCDTALSHTVPDTVLQVHKQTWFAMIGPPAM